MLRLDYANCFSDRIGDRGLAADALEAARPRLLDATRSLAATRGTGMTRWRDLPFDPVRGSHLDAIRAMVGPLRSRIDQVLVLGIGGSGLGNVALNQALSPVTANRDPSAVTLDVLDNVDPHLVGDTLDLLERRDPGLTRTLVNVISKSGETAETAAQFLLVRDRLERVLGPKAAEQIVAITDPDAGTMRQICNAGGYATLPVPEGVGGRFSVLSPVGLFSSAMCGLDIDGLLDGAAAMDTRCSSEDIESNPAAILAWLLVEYMTRGHRVHVLMAYANALVGLCHWFRQLWAESLGKQWDQAGREVFAGATPVAALGATDQHSQIQLYREGPHDKVVGFLEVETFDRDQTIPRRGDVPALAYLEGHTLSRLLAAEKRATEYALVESGRPNFTIRLPRLDASSVGGFLQLWMITTAYAGYLLDIDPYHQPAVETGKQATFGLMGRAGYEDWNQRVATRLDASQHVV